MKEAREQTPSASEVDEVRYFAYGANMNRDVFVRRRRFRPLSSERAILSGYELLFAAAGMTFVEPAFAALRAAPDGCVHGILYRLRRDDVDRLHRLEDGYERLAVDVRGVESGVAKAYTYNIPQLTHGLVPSRRYLGLLCDGARDAGLPNEYVTKLACHPSKYFPILSPLAAALAPLVEAVLLRKP